MSANTGTAFVCGSCGQDFPKWQGRCTACGSWNTITELRVPRRAPTRGKTPVQPSEVTLLSEARPRAASRFSTGYAEVDRVLGGGVVAGAMILLGGEPGIGKSTLLLQICAKMAREPGRVLYASGEESLDQTLVRANRLGLGDTAVGMLTETRVEAVLEHLQSRKPALAVVDSIQSMYSDGLESAPGSVSQVRECAAMLVRYANEHGTAIFLVGHVTKEGTIAGPRLLEHMVDTVLYFEGQSQYQYRLLRAVKNRFGPSGEITVLSMSDSGLHEVTNPSEFFMLNHARPQPGTATVPVLEGTRVLVVELQALVNPSHFGLPQRVASGINPRKLSLLLAVLERYGGVSLGDHDIFFNIAGGLRVDEPAADLGIVAAVLSSFRNRPAATGTAFLGELGLSGEVRRVSRTDIRLGELARLGFTTCVVGPSRTGKSRRAPTEGLAVVTCRNVADLADLMWR